MYNLTRYRYYFFGLSLLIIIPGLLALIFWHLNLGIDFTNGTTIDLRFQSNAVTSAGITRVFAQQKAQDVSVYPSTSSSAAKANRYVYITFNHSIGTSEESAVMTRLADSSKYKLPALTSNKSIDTFYQIGTGSNTTAEMIVLFNSPVTPTQVEAALQNLPKTDAPPANANGGTTSSPTPAATATATTAATATATATPTSTAQTFPVAVSQVLIGENEKTYEVNTQTDIISNTSSQENAIINALRSQFGSVYVQDHSSVGPAIASETTTNAILAVAVASVAILLYITIAFRKVGAWNLRLRFGASAIIALLHDAFVVLGLWAIFGHFFNFKVDTLFLTAILTVIGFSVHDTIVVFDRIRENLSRRTNETFGTVVDTSLLQTLTRSLNTSLTVLLVLSAEVLFGGDSIHEFVLALLIGIASGTYSSIFNASMILYVWQTGEYRKWFPWLKTTPPPAQRRLQRPVARVRA